jgi:hypothetical protein
MNHLEQRKRALVAESEVYRQMLNLEIQNLRLSGLGLGQKINQYRGLFTLIPLAGSLVGMLSGGLFRKRRKRGWRQFLGIGILGWRLYRKFGPFLQSGLAQWLARKPTTPPRAEEQTPAANI